MALSEERIAYYRKLIQDYEELLTRPHDEAFYTAMLSEKVQKTNEQHVLFLIEDAKEALKKELPPAVA